MTIVVGHALDNLSEADQTKVLISLQECRLCKTDAVDLLECSVLPFGCFRKWQTKTLIVKPIQI